MLMAVLIGQINAGFAAVLPAADDRKLSDDGTQSISESGFRILSPPTTGLNTITGSDTTFITTETAIFSLDFEGQLVGSDPSSVEAGFFVRFPQTMY